MLECIHEFWILFQKVIELLEFTSYFTCLFRLHLLHFRTSLPHNGDQSKPSDQHQWKDPPIGTQGEQTSPRAGHCQQPSGQSKYYPISCGSLFGHFKNWSISLISHIDDLMWKSSGIRKIRDIKWQNSRKTGGICRSSRTRPSTISYGPATAWRPSSMQRLRRSTTSFGRVSPTPPFDRYVVSLFSDPFVTLSSDRPVIELWNKGDCQL